MIIFLGHVWMGICRHAEAKEKWKGDWIRVAHLRAAGRDQNFGSANLRSLRTENRNN